MNGTVRKLFSLKGFGFIVDGAGHDYFFHASALEADGDAARRMLFAGLREGEKVSFEFETRAKGTRGTRAVHVKVLG